MQCLKVERNWDSSCGYKDLAKVVMFTFKQLIYWIYLPMHTSLTNWLSFPSNVSSAGFVRERSQAFIVRSGLFEQVVCICASNQESKSQRKSNWELYHLWAVDLKLLVLKYHVAHLWKMSTPRRLPQRSSFNRSDVHPGTCSLTPDWDKGPQWSMLPKGKNICRLVRDWDLLNEPNVSYSWNERCQ